MKSHLQAVCCIQEAIAGRLQCAGWGPRRSLLTDVVTSSEFILRMGSDHTAIAVTVFENMQYKPRFDLESSNR